MDEKAGNKEEKDRLAKQNLFLGKFKGATYRRLQRFIPPHGMIIPMVAIL
jgi:hypothetical protein